MKNFLNYLLYLNKCKVFRNLNNVMYVTMTDLENIWYDIQQITWLQRFESWVKMDFKNIDELNFGLKYLEIPEVLQEYENYFDNKKLKEEEIDFLSK